MQPTLLRYCTTLLTQLLQETRQLQQILKVHRGRATESVLQRAWHI